MTNNNNQQNQNPSSPFTRTNTNPANANNNQNNNTASRFGGSRFGNANAANANNNQNNNAGSRLGNANANTANANNNQNNNSTSPFAAGSRLNRFGQQAIYWTVAPLTECAIRISLDGLGDPFHRLLGTPLNVEYGKPEKVVAALQSDKDLLEQLSKVLDEAWEAYQFKGAALLFPWDEDVRKAYSQPVYPNDNIPDNPNPNNPNDPNNQNTFDDDAEWLDTLADNQKSNVKCLRAIDLAFVLNILARSRANVVVGNTPLALEPGFLTQTVVCDDPRIVALARATGCIDENW
jgi:hypothetical protein